MAVPRAPRSAASGASGASGGREHPKVGGVYWVEQHVFPSGDRKPRRPVVVLGEPIIGLDEVWVGTRTSQPVPGVHHPANPALGLNRDGWFSERNLRRIAARWLRDPRSARYEGQLESEYFEKLRARWQL